jgi:lipopolysaccharide transport system permease protein
MTAPKPIVVIEADLMDRNYWRDLWAFRELLMFLAWRDVLVQYKQTVIGVAWSVIRPMMTMVVFTVVFGRLAGLPANGVPYPVLVFCALLPWQFFATSLADASGSLLSNASMISKVYFPRLLVPMSAMAWYHIMPTWRLLALPGFLALALVTSLGVGFWFAALNTKFRDFRYIVPFMLQIGLYVSPVGFSSGVVPEKWRLLYSLNPMVAVIDGFRWAILGAEGTIFWPGFLLSCGLMVVIFASGVIYFRKMEKTFADVI